jgi:hypothetical protein
VADVADCVRVCDALPEIQYAHLILLAATSSLFLPAAGCRFGPASRRTSCRAWSR